MQKILNLKQGTLKAMFFVFFLLCSTVMLAQNKVSGTVLDATGEPLIGVSVLEDGTSNGVITDYDDFFLWVESLEENAKASVIAKDEDGEAVSITEAEIVKIVDRSDFDSEEEYEEASDDLGSDEDIDTMAEFMTADGIFYVGVRHVGEEQPVESFEIGDGVYYC